MLPLTSKKILLPNFHQQDMTTYFFASKDHASMKNDNLAQQKISNVN
jgi:hypothetical protein